MKPTALLINTARGPIVDQAALRAALLERRIAGAGLDVFEQEPCPADEPILALDNVIVTPHALCWTDECFAMNGAADVAAVKALMAGETPRGLIDSAVTAHAAWTARAERLAGTFAGAGCDPGPHGHRAGGPGSARRWASAATFFDAAHRAVAWASAPGIARPDCRPLPRTVSTRGGISR